MSFGLSPLGHSPLGLGPTAASQASPAQLSGSAQAVATGTGALTTVIRLNGAPTAVASASGSLSTAIRLAGTATAIASASGTLAGSSAALAGSAYVQASASGQLTTKIALAGAALVQAAATGALSSLAPSRAPIDISKISLSRIVTFEGSGSRVVVFEGSGNRVRFNTMSAKVATKVGDKWKVDRDPDEESYYAADITDELADRNTTLATGTGAVEIIVQGVTKLEDHSVQTLVVGGIQRTYIVVLLGGMDGTLPTDWLWAARVRCANGERFDKTTWFNRLDT